MKTFIRSRFFPSILFSLTVLLATGLMAPLVTEAQFAIDTDLRPEYAPQGWNEVYGGEQTDAEKYGSTAVSYILADIIVVLLQLAGVLAIYFIVTSGFNYVKAFGQDEEIQKAKKGLTWAIIGLLVVILSYAIVQNVIKIVLTVDQEAQEESSGESEGGGTSFLEENDLLIA